MQMYQRITMPKLHGTGPKDLASAIRIPSAPRQKFANLKEAMEYIKKKEEKKEEENER